VRAAAAGAPIRHFVDGLHAYMLEARADELRQLAVDAPVRRPTTTEFAAGPPSVDEVLRTLVEDCVVSPLLEAFQKTLARDFGGGRAEAALKKERAALRDAAPVALGLHPGLASREPWSAAIDALSGLDACALPSQQLAVVVEAARCVHEAHASLVEAGGEPAPPSCLAADEFLPVFIYCVVHADDSRNFLLARATLWALADPAELQAEPGYYLTMFDAALEYVASGDARKDAAKGGGGPG